jgi:hypothetical protein
MTGAVLTPTAPSVHDNSQPTLRILLADASFAGGILYKGPHT